MIFVHVKNFIAHYDRKWGEWFYFQLLSCLQPAYQVSNIEKSDLIHTDLFSNVENQNIKVRVYHKNYFESYFRILEKKVVIDSSTGWAYYCNIIPIWYSFPYARFPWKSYLKPTLFWCQCKNFFRRRDENFDHVINFIWYGWENYYHFLTDVVPTLYLIADSPYKKLPILVPADSFGKSFVKEFINLLPEIRDLNYFPIESNKLVTINYSVCFAKAKKYEKFPRLFCRDRYFHIIQGMSSLGIQRVFLYRPKDAIRSLLNTMEMIEILTDYGFKCIDTSNTPITQQMRLFRDVKVCIGIHGAGLTNLIFCLNPFTLIELNSNKKYIPDHYNHIASLLCAKYELAIGSVPNERLQFSVDPSVVLQLLDKVE